MKTFSVEEALQAELLRTVWNRVVNSGYDGVEKKNMDSGVAQNSLTAAFLTEKLEDDEERVWEANQCADMDALFHWIGESSRLEDHGRVRFSRKLEAALF